MDLIGGRWATPRAFLKDLRLALVLLPAGWISLGLFQWFGNVRPSPAVMKLIPHGPAELVTWCGLAITAGFCEELLYRGYLLRQFSAWTKSSSTSLVLQSVVFGLGHAYQGLPHIALLTVLGCMFGVLALWRQSLRPGMMVHGLQDLLAGIVGALRR